MANQEDALTFEDLAIDDTLDDLGRVCKYAFSPIALQRLVHVRMLTGVGRQEGLEVSRAKLFPLLDSLAKDMEYVIRQNVAQQLWGLAQLGVEDGSVAGYADIVESILPVLARLVADPQPEVRLAAGESLVELAKHIKQEDLGPRVLTFVLELAHDMDAEELRMTAAVLLNELAPTLGPELCQQFVVPEVVALSEDSSFRVRKATALNMNNICATATADVTVSRLMPAFVRLSKDDIWGVRKAVAESLVAMSRAVSVEQRVADLIPICERFVTEVSDWTRTATLHHLGPFLATLPSEQVSAELLAHYTRMGLRDDNSETAGAELRIFCAFSFPAVVQTLGPSRWGELRQLFQALTRDVQRNVRRTLACSLHEVAKILGPELAEQELESTFQFYLKDLEPVRAGVVSHVAEFLGALSPACRESYLPILDEIITRNERLHWRFRLLLAKQVAALSNLFSSAATYSVVVPLAIRLLRDDVAAVRLETTRSIPALVRRLGEADPAWRITVVGKLLELGKSEDFHHRVTLVSFCKELAEQMEPSIFSSLFLPALVRASKDSCRNVRLRVARLCGANPALKGPDWLLKNSQVVDIVKRFRTDSDREVVAEANACSLPSEQPTVDPGCGEGQSTAAEPSSSASVEPRRITAEQLAAVRQIANTAAQLALADAMRKMGTKVSAAVMAKAADATPEMVQVDMS